jgi:predicted nucleotidyltransferase
VAPELHTALRQNARDSGLSLNEFCARKLASPVGAVDSTSPASAAVKRAASLFGADLVGVAAIGSWARAQAFTRSDVDLLVAVDPLRELTRGLYREWDADPPTWEAREVDVHFAHLPAIDAPVSALWAECAIDGIVLFERDYALSKLLACIRREIAAGRLVRRTAHGQPYWSEVA